MCIRDSGSVVNLGIGMPTLVGDYLPPDKDILLHSENGITGMGPAAAGDAIDPDPVSYTHLDVYKRQRQDTTVVIHPLTDARRILPLDKKGEVVHAHPDFQLVVSYNPGYQSSAKDLKPSTRQRFVALDFDYPDAVHEAAIVAHEAGIDADLARRLVRSAHSSRELKHHGLDEGCLLYTSRCV